MSELWLLHVQGVHPRGGWKLVISDM